MATKKCKKCKQEKSIDDFYACRSADDGKQPACKECDRARMRSYREKANRDGVMDYSEKNRFKLRYEVLSHYSGGTPECSCCHEKHYEFLAIDHMGGGGRKHRLEVKSVYQWIKRNNFPTGFRVLCHNCNQSIGAYGYCPHNTKSRFADLYAQEAALRANPSPEKSNSLPPKIDRT